MGKGGYLLIDNLPFLKAADPIMKYLTIKAGVFQPNVGDQIFRRSDNGNVINNPFVGNYVMDDFTTNTGIEVYFRKNGLLILGGVNSGNLKPALGGTEGSGTSKEYVGYDLVDELAINWKLSYDKQVTEDLRLRASLSGYHVGDTHSTTIHSGDRTGSRYYLVMNTQNDGTTEFDVTKNHMSGNFYPGSGTKDNTLVANIFANSNGSKSLVLTNRPKANAPILPLSLKPNTTLPSWPSKVLPVLANKTNGLLALATML